MHFFGRPGMVLHWSHFHSHGMTQSVMVLQITASVTFLPLLNDRCSFDLLVYTDAQSAVPLEW